MAKHSYKQYTANARRGIRGEAFFESLIVEHAIPHQLARQNDLGVDFICEWVDTDTGCPTGILFAVQVKTTTKKQAAPERINSQSPLNWLPTFKLKGARKWYDDNTIAYWKSLWLPAYLCVVVEEAGGPAQCYYKRCTPLLDGHASNDDKEPTRLYYHAEKNGGGFRAFADEASRTGGFARDLIVDYARLHYARGYVVPLDKEKLGVWPFRTVEVGEPFEDSLRWNRQQIEKTCKDTLKWLKKLPNDVGGA